MDMESMNLKNDVEFGYMRTSMNKRYFVKNGRGVHETDMYGTPFGFDTLAEASAYAKMMNRDIGDEFDRFRAYRPK